MLNRRWFFTATGSAFLTAACAVVTNNGNEPECEPVNDPKKAPQDPHIQFEALMTAFFHGLHDQLGRETNRDERPRLTAYLEKIYRPRFDYRWEMNELPDKCYVLRLHQACVLGQLTGLAYAYETGSQDDPQAWSFARPREGQDLKLDERHIEWARDSYGLYTNSSPKMKKRARALGRKRPLDLCGEPNGPVPPGTETRGGRQIDQACPFCFA